MEVFTVSVGIGRVAISVCRTRQVVSRLHADIYHDCWKSAHHHKRYTLSGLTPLCRDSGDVAPSGPYTCRATVFKLAGLIRLAKSNAFETSEPARTAPDSLSPYQGTVFKPFGLVGELKFEHLDRPQTSALLDRLRESRAPLPDGRTPTIPAGYLNVVAWWWAR